MVLRFTLVPHTVLVVELEGNRTVEVFLVHQQVVVLGNLSIHYEMAVDRAVGRGSICNRAIGGRIAIIAAVIRIRKVICQHIVGCLVGIARRCTLSRCIYQQVPRLVAVDDAQQATIV